MIFDKNTTIIQINCYIVNSYQTLTKLKMGRPPTKPARLRNGFYIEVKSQGSSAILIRRDTREQMLMAAEDYSRPKMSLLKVK
jgi:hypothetical protein